MVILVFFFSFLFPLTCLFFLTLSSRPFLPPLLPPLLPFSSFRYARFTLYMQGFAAPKTRPWGPSSNRKRKRNKRGHLYGSRGVEPFPALEHCLVLC